MTAFHTRTLQMAGVGLAAGGGVPGGDARHAAASSALACLVAVARAHGLSLSAEALAAGASFGPREPSLAELAACAERAGFRCKAMTLDQAAITDLRGALPAILRLRDGSSRVLLRIAGGDAVPAVELLDPAMPGQEPAVLGGAELDRLWDGAVLLLKVSATPAVGQGTFGWGTLWTDMVGEGRLLRDLGLATILLGLLALAPILFAWALLGDAFVDQAARTLAFLCLGFVTLVAFETGFAAVRRGAVTRLSTRIGLRLDTMMMERVLGLPLAAFERTPRGVIAHALAQGIAVRAALAGPLAALLLDAAIALALVPALLITNLTLGIVTLVVAALVGITLGLAMPRHRRAVTALAAADAEADTFMAETITGFGTLKALALEGRQRRLWDVLTARTARLRLAEAAGARRLRVLGRLGARLMVFGPLALGAALAVAGSEPVSRPSLFAFLLLALRVSQPLDDIAMVSRRLNEARAAVAGMAGIANMTPERDPARRGARPPLRGQVTFSGVTFTYPGAPAPALQSVSFEVPAGTILGIMGRSGAGKSTLARLMQLMHADFQGLIKLDGIDLRDLDLDHLRQGVLVVGQDSVLFPGTVREALLAGRPDAGADVMLHAVRLAGAEALIEALPDGYDTVLREGAIPLSEGERQRLAIARALVADPRVLILDEATSALDPESEARIAGNLKRIAEGRTLVVITQRLASLAQADAVLVLDRGEVQDMGRHQELIGRSDIYSALWHRQTRRLERGPPADRLLSRGTHVA